MNKHDKCANELNYQICANRSLIYISSFEEHRVIEVIAKICKEKSPPWSYAVWDIAEGVTGNNPAFNPKPEALDQAGVLSWFQDVKVGTEDYLVLVLKDFYKFLSPDGFPGQIEIETIRKLRNLAEKCSRERKAIVLLGATYFLPPELEKFCLLIDWPLPEKEQITNKIESLLGHARKRTELKTKFKLDYDENEMDNVVKSFMGLTLNEIELLTSYFFLTKDQLYPESIAKSKQDIIKKNGLVEWIDVDINFNEVGGLQELKNWLHQRRHSFSEEAVKYGLPPNPKGVLMLGIQGSGKSLSSKAIAYFWKMPLIRLDVGKIFSGIVGSSEENLRNIIKLVESVAPCVLWIDEMDKGFGTNSGSHDGGTTSRVAATLLTWMQEKQAAVFIVATANDVSSLPPELLRKGRFDEIFYVDLPDKEERRDIFKIHLKKRHRDPDNFDLSVLIEASDGYTGAEIEAAIVSALYEGFDDNKREITTADIANALNETVPISITMKEKIGALRQWAQGRARHASHKNKVGRMEVFDKHPYKTNDNELELHEEL